MLLDLRDRGQLPGGAHRWTAAPSTRSTSSRPTWAAWASSTRPSARSCTTASLINVHMTRPGRPAGRAALLLLVVGVRLPRHEARRAGDDRSRGRPGPPGQRVRLGEALLRAHGAGLRPALRHAGAHRPLPELLRARRAPGPAAARRRRRPCAARWPRSKTAARSRSGATARGALVHLRQRHGGRHLPADALGPAKARRTSAARSTSP